jgi:outer membrane protein TolC
VATLTRQARHAYWEWSHALDILDVRRESLRLAEVLLEENRERVRTGAMAAVDIIEAEAEVARRGEAILIGTKNVANAEDALRRLLLDPAGPEFISPLQRGDGARAAPARERPDGGPNQAFDTRQDLRLAESALASTAVTIQLLRDDTRPDVSLSLNYGVQSVGGTELLRTGGFPGTVIGTTQRTLATAIGDLWTNRFPTWSIELAVSYPVGLARPEAELLQAVIQRRQQEAILRDTELAVRTELAIAAREVETNRGRIVSTRTAVDLAERRLEAEQRKFTAGLSTSFFVFQAQRDLAVAREAALRAILDLERSTADLSAAEIVPLGLAQPAAVR